MSDEPRNPHSSPHADKACETAWTEGWHAGKAAGRSEAAAEITNLLREYRERAARGIGYRIAAAIKARLREDTFGDYVLLPAVHDAIDSAFVAGLQKHDGGLWEGLATAKECAACCERYGRPLPASPDNPETEE